MKVTFRGMKRQVQTHNRKTTLTWICANVASGSLRGLGLTGNFRATFEFETEELEQWIAKYLEEDPAAALRLASRIQAEAICALAADGKANVGT